MTKRPPRKPPFSAADLIPDRPTLPKVRDAAAGCKACPLWKRATQTVFGEGPRKSTIMFVGEQPGDQEDSTGRPFVGPAGRVLDRALAEAGIDRAEVYVTNVVKHFKWEPRGKRRIHKKPNAAEIGACRPWLRDRDRCRQAGALVCLGATAAQALLGRDFKVVAATGRAGGVVARRHCHRDDPSVRDPSRAGRRRSRDGTAAVRRGFAEGEGISQDAVGPTFRSGVSGSAECRSL